MTDKTIIYKYIIFQFVSQLLIPIKQLKMLLITIHHHIIIKQTQITNVIIIRYYKRILERLPDSKVCQRAGNLHTNIVLLVNDFTNML